MKKTCIFILIFSFLVTAPSFTDAALKLLEDKHKMDIDISGFPVQIQARYKLFRTKCSQHHGLYRPISAIMTGKTPLTEKNFGKPEVKKYIIKMMRKPNSGVNRDNGKEIIKFIYYLIDNRRILKKIKE